MYLKLRIVVADDGAQVNRAVNAAVASAGRAAANKPLFNEADVCTLGTETALSEGRRGSEDTGEQPLSGGVGLHRATDASK